MAKYIMLIKLQIKTAFAALPKIFAGMAVFTLLLVFFAVGASAAAESSDKQEKMEVALVLPDDNISAAVRQENTYIRQAFDFLGKIETVSTVCSFVFEAEEQEALKQLAAGRYTAVVVIPERFISGIMNGENVPARIVFERSGVNTTSAVFREMLRAGAADLSTAQAGIYAVEDACRELIRRAGALAEADQVLNDTYFSYALDRNIYFKVQPVSARGSLSTVQFYAAAGLVLLFLMGSITCAELLKADAPVLTAAMKRSGIVSGVNHIFKVIGVTVVFFCLFSLIYILAVLSVLRYPQVKIVLEPGNILLGLVGLFVLLLAVFSMAGMIYKLAGKTVSGMLILFLLSVVMMFASGCFVPAAMLPPIVAQMGNVLPTAWFFKLCGQILTGNVGVLSLMVNLIYAAGFFAVSAAVDRIGKALG